MMKKRKTRLCLTPPSTSGGSGGGSSTTNIRYNPETDTVQLCDADGNWHDWKQGGLIKYYIYKDGLIQDDNKFVAAYNPNGYKNMTPSTSYDGTSFLINATTSSGSWNYSSWAASVGIERGNYTKLKLRCDVRSDYDRIDFGYSTENITQKTNSWSALAHVVNLSRNSTLNDIVVEISISEDIIYPAIVFNGYSTCYVRIYDMWLE